MYCKYRVEKTSHPFSLPYQENQENVIQIHNLIDFGQDWLRMNKDLFIYEGQF